MRSTNQNLLARAFIIVIISSNHEKLTFRNYFIDHYLALTLYVEDLDQ